MFKDVNEFENRIGNCYSVSGNIVFALSNIKTHEKIYAYKTTDFLLKKNTNMANLHTSVCGSIKRTYGINAYNFSNLDNQNIVTYVINNFIVIQGVRKIINNYDILLFDITNDLQFIKQILLITKSKHKNLPKCVIIYKILYYYLLDKN